MEHASFALILVVYVFVVGFFNFSFALASGLMMLSSYRRHNGRLGKRLWH